MPSARRKHWTLLRFGRFCRLFDYSKQINSPSIVTIELPDTVHTDLKVCGRLVFPEGTRQSLRRCFVCVMSLFTMINKHSEMFETQNSVCVLTAVTLALPGLLAASWWVIPAPRARSFGSSDSRLQSMQHHCCSMMLSLNIDLVGSCISRGVNTRLTNFLVNNMFSSTFSHHRTSDSDPGFLLNRNRS